MPNDHIRHFLRELFGSLHDKATDFKGRQILFRPGYEISRTDPGFEVEQTQLQNSDMLLADFGATKMVTKWVKFICSKFFLSWEEEEEIKKKELNQAVLKLLVSSIYERNGL